PPAAATATRASSGRSCVDITPIASFETPGSHDRFPYTARAGVRDRCAAQEPRATRARGADGAPTWPGPADARGGRPLLEGPLRGARRELAACRMAAA